MTQPHLTSNAGASFMQKPKNIDMDDETKKISEMICPQIITLATNIVNEKTKTNNFKTWFCNLKKNKKNPEEAWMKLRKNYHWIEKRALMNQNTNSYYSRVYEKNSTNLLKKHLNNGGKITKNNSKQTSQKN